MWRACIVNVTVGVRWFGLRLFRGKHEHGRLPKPLPWRGVDFPGISIGRTFPGFDPSFTSER